MMSGAPAPKQSRQAQKASSRLAALQTLTFHAPDQEIDAILTEERLVLECECRDAPMARCGVVLLIIGDHTLISVRLRGNGRIHCGEIEAGGLGRFGEM